MEKPQRSGSGCCLIQLLLLPIKLIVALVKALSTVITSTVKWLNQQKITLPIGKGYQVSGLLASLFLCLFFICGSMVYTWTDAQLRTVGLLPTWTPTSTRTLTPTSTETPMPTNTPTPSPIPTDTPRPTDTPTPMVGTIATEALNLRDGPGMEYAIIDRLVQGNVISIIAQDPEGDWLKVEHKGKIGWVAKTYVEMPAEVAMIPTAEIPPTPTVTPTPKATSTPQSSPMPESNWGKWFYSGKAAVATTDIDRRGELGIWKPSTGYVFVSVAIAYANRADSGTVHCNRFYFQIMTGGGLIYDPSVAALEPSLKAVDLAPGVKTQGWITFEVPADAADLTLLWKPSLFAETVYIPLK